MALVINNNMMAATAARNLNNSYGNLNKSVNRLSSGLRINSAADDAAGLAIREMMRADVTALNQGVRNANDAISLIQTADGALGVIDEKLIRMKELAEQASTGTYTSTQRLIIDSEYQAMASEITRIANSTDFNGIKLLDGSLSSNQHSGVGQDATGKLKVHFGAGNDSAEDYYYIQIQNVTAKALGVGNSTNYKDMMATAKTASLDMLQENFGSMKTGDSAARAAFSRMEQATNDLFAEVETKVNAIFSVDGNAEVNFNQLFSKVDVKAAMAGATWGSTTGSETSNAALMFSALSLDLDKARVYASKEELDEAAKALYNEMAGNAMLKGYSAGLNATSAAASSFLNSTLQASALTAIAKLYDKAIIAADGADVPGAVNKGDFAKMTDGQKDAMKASVSMAMLNTMTNGSTVSMSANTGDGAQGTGLGQLNNMDAAGVKNITGTALLADGTKLSDAQLTNIFSKMQGGFAMAVGTVGNTLNGALLDGRPGGAVATGGLGKMLLTVGAGAAGGYQPGNATTNIDTTFGTFANANAATDTGFGRAGYAANSLAKAFAGVSADRANQTAALASLAGNNILTQDSAQKALGALDAAILKKDNVRADLGALQNRLENTITNLQVQSENLQAAESRISDVDVATEMTQFVKSQILTQTAVSMLAQANTMPQMAQKLIG